MREIDEQILEAACKKFGALIQQEIEAGTLPTEVVYACLHAITEKLDNGTNQFAAFFHDATLEVIAMSKVGKVQ